MALARGVAFTLTVPFPTSGLTITPTLSMDGGTFVPATNTCAEIGTTKLYRLVLTTTEMDVAKQVDVCLSPSAGDVKVATLVTDPTDVATAAALASAVAYIDTEIADIKAQTDKLTFSVGNRIASDMQAIDGALTTGNNATLNLKALNVVNSTGTAVLMQSSGGDGKGLHLIGNGTGNALHAQGGASGSGISGFAGTNGTAGIAGQATNGHGLLGVSLTVGDGIRGVATSGNGMSGSGGTAGHGLRTVGGATGNGFSTSGGSTSGAGIAAAATAGNGSGIVALGNAAGHGMSLAGGATGAGMRAIGGATSGDGINATGGAVGHGIFGYGGSTSGQGIRGQGQTLGHGIVGTGGGATMSGIVALGQTTGSGIMATGGTTGDGMKVVGGATSGDGFVAIKTGASSVPIRGDITGNVTGNLSGSVGSVTTIDKTGYALTSAERTAIANEVEVQIINDTDSEKVLTAITDKIAAVNPSFEELSLSAIAAANRVEMDTNSIKLDVAVSTRLADADYEAPPSLAGVALEASVQGVAAQVTALHDFDPALDTVARVALVDRTTLNDDALQWAYVPAP